MEYKLEFYQKKYSDTPFEDWLFYEVDLQVRHRIHMRLERLRLGNFGDCKALKDGIHELRLDFGPGYRIYFAKIGKSVVLLLWAGTKRTQARDIEKARKYLEDFKSKDMKHEKK